MVTGRDPTELIDHRDGDGANNRWNNIREATFSENNRNRRIGEANTSGVKGICWENSRKKWRAYVYVNDKVVLVGRFNDFGEAREQLLAERNRLHGEFARSA
jgi:hypothetical protein